MKLTHTLFLSTLLFLFNVNVSLAEGKSSIQQTVFTLPKTSLTIKQVLDEINKIPEISVVYGNIDEYLNTVVHFSHKSISVQKALDEIGLIAPVDIIFNNNHIIIKRRIMSDIYNLKGIVYDSKTGERLIAAYIYIKGAKNASVTDSQGNFTIQLKPGNYLIGCRFVGYTEQEIQVSLYKDVTVEFKMEVDQQEINEINILGNIVDTKSIEQGRPIETIESIVINKLNTNDVNDALHGRVNGVWTTKVSGAPGDHNKVRIRGISSIFGSTDPLYVVDGMIVPIVNLKTLGIADLNNHDVNSITILKDASSTALYGYQGGNGVVIIETKKGGGKTTFNFGIKKGLQQFYKRYDLMDSESFLRTHELSDSINNTKFYTVSKTIGKYELYPRYQDSLGNKLGYDNFQDEIFTLGDISEFQLSGQGQCKGIDYYLSGNSYNHNGVIVNSSYKKYSVTGNFSKLIDDKMSLRLLYKGSHQENQNNIDNYMANNIIFKGINFEPAYRSTPDSFLYKNERLYYNDKNNPSNYSLSTNYYSPDELFYQQKKLKVENNHSISLLGFYRIDNEFSFRANLTYSNHTNIFSSYLPSIFLGDKYLQSKENYQVFCQQYDVNFEKKLNRHYINAFFRFRNYNDKVKWEVDSIRNVELDGLKPENDIYMRGSQSIFGEEGSVNRLINSTILNINYNYAKKYFVSLIINYDKLKEGVYVNKNDLFPSIALNWDLSKEERLNTPKWINELNLCASWGQSGNYPLNGLSNDLYLTTLKYTSNNQIVNGAYISNLANHNITHEKVTEMNFGSKITLFKERVMFSIDYYTKTNTNLLIRRDIPYYYGGGTIFMNIGEMKNTGVEASLELIPFNSSSFYWLTRAGISTNRQYITKLDNGKPIKFNDTDILFPDFIASENEVLGSIIGYNYQGRWEDLKPEDIQSNKYLQSSGLAYVKLDSVNKRRPTEIDKMIIGNSIPKFTLNWLNSVEFKNVTIDMLWYGVLGVDKYNATKASTYLVGTNQDLQNILNDRLKYMSDNCFYESSFFVEDASFLRLKTLSITYHQPKKIASKISMEYTLGFENLVTLTRYSGYDPEATIYTNNNFSDNAIDRGAYPNPCGVYFSINMTF